MFAARDECVEIVEENLDEGVLCELRAGAPGAVPVVKLYDDDAALER